MSTTSDEGDARHLTADLLLADDGAPLPFQVATDELSEILAGLESADIDVDRLSDQVERATALIRHCRARLNTVKAEVDEVVEDMRDTDV